MSSLLPSDSVVEFAQCECDSFHDAVEYISFKVYDKWQVLVPPMEVQKGHWNFILYKWV